MAELNNPWENRYNKWVDKKFESNKWNEASPFAKQQEEDLFSFLDCDRKNLADAAECLAKNAKLVIESYRRALLEDENGDIDWFFSINPNLNSVTIKPNNFETWDHWKNFNYRQQRTIANLSEEFSNENEVKVKDPEDLKILQKGYKRWGKAFYSYFWGDEPWACNLFLGDSLFLWKSYNNVNNSNFYLSPKDLFKVPSPFSELSKSEGVVQRGDIAVYAGDSGNGDHIEIITDVNFNKINPDFCSISAGRGDGTNGKIKCNSDNNERLISNTGIKFLRFQ